MFFYPLKEDYNFFITQTHINGSIVCVAKNNEKHSLCNRLSGNQIDSIEKFNFNIKHELCKHCFEQYVFEINSESEFRKHKFKIGHTIFILKAKQEVVIEFIDYTDGCYIFNKEVNGTKRHSFKSIDV